MSLSIFNRGAEKDVLNCYKYDYVHEDVEWIILYHADDGQFKKSPIQPRLPNQTNRNCKPCELLTIRI
ncbi:MAG: hypothetical protein M5F18_13500 [Asgard group archaeon]|nr:hypothetical protein [Asgard group archaeon]